MRKRKKTLNLLEVSSSERRRLVKEINQKLKKRALECKLHQMLLQVENLTINGNIVYEENQQWNGLRLGMS